MLKVKNLTKKFAKFTAVSNESFEVVAGEVVGFVGPNGSGKSTTIDMILGMTSPSSGEIYIDGEKLRRDNTAPLHQHVAYLSTDMNLDRNLTGYQALKYFANLRGKWHPEVDNKVKALASKLDANLNKKIKHLSRGNRQKIGLIAAVMNTPKLLVMDEPTSGFDPIVQNAFIDIIREHQKNGGAVFISSHNLSEVSEICDRVIFIIGGQIVANELMSTLQKMAPKREVIDLDAVFEALVQKNSHHIGNDKGDEYAQKYI